MIIHVPTELTKVEKQLKVMEEYLRLQLENRDWHGVMDAAAEIRELESKYSVLLDCRESI